MSEVSLFRFGGDLLSHVLRRSTIGATALNGRVRDGIGCFARAMTTKPEKRQGGGDFHRSLPKHQGLFQVFVTCCLRAFDDHGAKVFALLFPDQIKPIEQLVPVS